MISLLKICRKNIKNYDEISKKKLSCVFSTLIFTNIAI